MSAKFWLYLIFIVSISSRVDAVKDKKLVMLALILQTGGAPSNGSMCKAAMEVAVDAANNLTSLLPDYHVTLEFRDEAQGALTPRHLIEMSRKFEATTTADEYLAPVTVGSLITTGCASSGRFLHHINQVLLPTGCLAPSMTEHRESFPNIYRARAPGELTIYPRIQFIKNIGHWDEIAIITHAGNSMDYYIAKEMFDESQRAGLKIVFFDAVSDFSDLAMLSLKNSDARIITIETNQQSPFWRFMCQAWKHGIKGSKYVFIMPVHPYTDPKILPKVMPGNPGCTKENYMEQLAISFVIGSTPSTIENDWNNEQLLPLGYSPTEFDRRFEAWIQGHRDPDYNLAHSCHDVAMHGLLTLDKADRELKQNYNLSLMSFAKDPKTVMLVVNKTAGTLPPYRSLRLRETKYSSRLERDFEPHVIGQWFAEDQSYHNIFVLKANDTTESIHQYSEWKITQLRPLKWQTANGLPPRDKWVSLKNTRTMSPAVFAIVLTVAAVLTISQLLAASFLMFRSWKQDKMAEDTLPISKVMLSLGCFIVYAGAIVISLDPQDTKNCIARYAVLVTGMAVINGYLFSKMMLYSSRARAGQIVSMKMSTQTSMKTARKGRSFRQRFQTSNATSLGHPPSFGSSSTFCQTTWFDLYPQPFLDKFVVLGSCLVTVLVLIGVAIWQTLMPFQHKIFKSEPEYNSELDAYVYTEYNGCYLKLNLTWLIIPAFQLLLLTIASFLAYELRASPGAQKAPEFNLMRAAIANNATLSYGGVLVVLILQDLLAKQIVAAFVTLIIAGTTGSIVLFPAVASILRSRLIVRVAAEEED